MKWTRVLRRATSGALKIGRGQFTPPGERLAIPVSLMEYAALVVGVVHLGAVRADASARLQRSLPRGVRWTFNLFSPKGEPHISVFNCISESSDRYHHQYFCGSERDEDAPEISTQWVKHKINPSSSPSTPP